VKRDFIFWLYFVIFLYAADIFVWEERIESSTIEPEYIIKNIAIKRYLFILLFHCWLWEYSIYFYNSCWYDFYMFRSGDVIEGGISNKQICLANRLLKRSATYNSTESNLLLQYKKEDNCQK